MSVGIDTNVLVRYLVQDDPEQSRRAAALIEEGCTPENPGVVSVVVLCELVWVLQRAYGCHRENVAEVLEGILRAEDILVPESELAWRALRAYEAGRADFADYVIAYAHERVGAPFTYTFDRRAAQEDLFREVPER